MRGKEPRRAASPSLLTGATNHAPPFPLEKLSLLSQHLLRAGSPAGPPLRGRSSSICSTMRTKTPHVLEEVTGQLRNSLPWSNPLSPSDTLYKNFCDGYAQRFRARVPETSLLPTERHVSITGRHLRGRRIHAGRARSSHVHSHHSQGAGGALGAELLQLFSSPLQRFAGSTAPAAPRSRRHRGAQEGHQVHHRPLLARSASPSPTTSNPRRAGTVSSPLRGLIRPLQEDEALQQH